MRLTIGLITCFCAFQAFQALADEQPVPAASQAAPAAAATAATPASSSASTQSASTAKPAASADDAASEEATDKRLRSQGYRPEMRNGTKIYCRKEAAIGSRFESKVCATPEQIAQATKDSQDALYKSQINRGGPKSD
jgi:hypothetical protein